MQTRRGCQPTPLFFFNDTATAEIYTLSLHDALPISIDQPTRKGFGMELLTRFLPYDLNAETDLDFQGRGLAFEMRLPLDRKSTRLNSSHANISYAVFCLKKRNSKTKLPYFYYLYILY